MPIGPSYESMPRRFIPQPLSETISQANKPSYRADARDALGSGAAGAHVSRISGAFGIACVMGALGKVLPARLVGLGF